METMNSINERLAYIIKKEGHTVSSFAKKCGLPDPTVRNLLPSAKTKRRPSYDIIVAIITAVNHGVTRTGLCSVSSPRRSLLIQRNYLRSLMTSRKPSMNFSKRTVT